MALTRPKISNINTDIVGFLDPITVLHQGASQPNIDVGFLFNRANGLVSNVALYWSESANAIVTSFTSNSGSSNGNVQSTGYANVAIGSLIMLNGAGIYVGGNIGDPGSVMTSTGTGVVWAAAGGFNGGTITNSFYINDPSTTASTSTTTGALRVSGGVGITGNTYIGGQVTSNGNVVITSGTATTSTSTGALQVTGGVGIGGGLYVGNKIVVTGNVLPSANVTYNLGSDTSRWKDLYLSGGTIYLNTASISASSGKVTITNDSGGSFSVTGSASGQSTGTFGNLVANSGVASTSTSTGALIVTGGMGVSGAAYHGSVYDNGNRVLTSLSSSGAGNLTVSVSAPASTTVALPATGPGATTTGSATAIPVITTDAYGRISGITTASVSSTLNLAGTSGTGSVSLTNQSLTFAGGNGMTASASGQTITVSTPQNLQTTASPTFAGLTSGNIFIGVWPGGGSYNTIQQAGMTGSEYGMIMGQTDKNTYISSWTGGTVNIRGGGNSSTYQIAVGTGSIAVTGTMTTNAIVPSANVTYNLGSTTAWWNIVYGKAVQAQYADLAENYITDYPYEPGTVVVFGGEAEITVTSTDHDPAVAGVVSTNPAYLMNSMTDGLPIALQGRVPCRVQGPVKKGQVLVTSTTPGVAQAIDNTKFVPGCVIGKALETINTNNIETIEVVVGKH